jgi:hypothetical protein
VTDEGYKSGTSSPYPWICQNVCNLRFLL